MGQRIALEFRISVDVNEPTGTTLMIGKPVRCWLAVALIATGSVAASEPVTTDLPVAAAPSSTALSTLQRLQDLIGSDSLEELRTNYNGHYGASLLFHAESLTYYAALFQDKTFWRAISTRSEQEAEEAYRSFAKQTEALAEVDIRSITLNAQKVHAERLLASDGQRLEALQRDIAQQRQQAQEVATRQEQARLQTATLGNEQRAVQERLSSLQNRIRALETQQADLNVALPKPVVPTPEAVNVPAPAEPATPVVDARPAPVAVTSESKPKPATKR